MAQQHSADAPQNPAVPMAFLSFGETAVGLQKELLRAGQRLNRIWLERMQVEVALWTRLVSDLASSKSEADFMKAYTDHITRQFRLNAEDGRHIFHDYQEMARKIAGDVERAIHDPDPEETRDFASEARVTH